MHVRVALPFWVKEVGSEFVTIGSLKTKNTVLSLIRAGLEAGAQPLNQDSLLELLCHLVSTMEVCLAGVIWVGTS